MKAKRQSVTRSKDSKVFLSSCSMLVSSNWKRGVIRGGSGEDFEEGRARARRQKILIW